ncbi:MAG: hypothetical protein CTY30_02755 [Methylocystis sp.]|nr:MAG: hypothetical protein CTY30_02755 [Methylocystis sp.]
MARPSGAKKRIRFPERAELPQSWMFSKRFRGVAVKPRSFGVMSGPSLSMRYRVLGLMPRAAGAMRRD